MAISCGVVGLPNVGKSTLFNALTCAQSPAENFPFCTIEPSQGRVVVSDPRLIALAELAKPKSVVPATIEMWDIAGLVRGASQGEGLGNQFLHHIREVDAILHVVRCFDTQKVVHVAGRIDPIADVETIEMELILADIAALERWSARAQTGKSAKTSEGKERCELFQQLIAFLYSDQPARQFPFSEHQRHLMKGFALLTSKPVLYVANCAETESETFLSFKEYALKKGLNFLPLSIAQEAGLAQMSPSEREEMQEALGITSMLPQLICGAMKLLNLQTFFTVGPQEVRAWSIPIHTCAQVAAGAIHSDLSRGFIRAEVIAYEDFVHFKSEAQARAHGKLRSEGKEYLVQDGDIIHFRFNV